MASAFELEEELQQTDRSGQRESEEWSHPIPARHFAWFGWLDRILGMLLLVPGLPAITCLTLIARLTSRGPGLYRQTRVGYQGRTFTLYKIRSMTNDAEADTGPVWAAGKGDPRITRFGRFLRSSHLDELPQLFNVVRGEMSLIGPRPERPEFTQFLAHEISGYLGRLSVRPGITGLAQINLPPDSDLESVFKKLELDLDYIHNSSLGMDSRILLCTGLKMFGFDGLYLAKVFRLRRRPTGHAVAGRRAGSTRSPSVPQRQQGSPSGINGTDGSDRIERGFSSDLDNSLGLGSAVPSNGSGTKTNGTARTSLPDDVSVVDVSTRDRECETDLR